MNDLKVYFQHRGVRIAAAVLAAGLLVLVLWLVFRPSLADLERKAAEERAKHEAAQKAGEDKLAAERAAFERAIAGHAQDRNAQEARLSEIESQVSRQTAEFRISNARTIALLNERTQGRQADLGRVATATAPELHARATSLVGELQAPDETYRNVIRLAVDRDQARDELAVAKETLSGKDKELALTQQLAEERKTSLQSEKAHADQLAGLMKSQQDAFGSTLAELRAKSEAEREANEKLIKRLKGNGFLRAVKTGAKIGAGVGIGIAIGRAMQ